MHHFSFNVLTYISDNGKWPVNSSLKGPVTRKMFPFDDVIMWHHYGNDVIVMLTVCHFTFLFYDSNFSLYGNCYDHSRYDPLKMADGGNGKFSPMPRILFCLQIYYRLSLEHGVRFIFIILYQCQKHLRLHTWAKHHWKKRAADRNGKDIWS